MRSISPALAGKPFLFISGNCPLLRETSLRSLLGGAYRDRTDDLMLAKQPLSQLS